MEKILVVIGCGVAIFFIGQQYPDLFGFVIIVLAILALIYWKPATLFGFKNTTAFIPKKNPSPKKAKSQK